MDNYPTLRLGVLQGLKALKAAVDADENHLLRPECPYDNDTKDLLKDLFKPKTVEVIKEVQVEKPERGKVGRPKKDKELTEDEGEEVEREAKELLKELRELAKNGDGELKQLDTGTKLQIIKTRTTLLEKLVVLRERCTSVRKQVEFQQTVIEILDELVEDDKRDAFLTKLEKFL